VKDLFAISPEFRKQFHNLTMVKRVTNPSTNIVQVNKLSILDPDAISHDFSDQVLRSDEGLIVTHHSLPLQAVDAKVRGLGCVIQGVLDLDSEIIAMPKHIWKDLGLLIWSDHTMKMSLANTSIDTSIGILENLVLDLGMGEVMVQVQILAHANFDLLLGQPFHCLMSTTMDNFPDGSQTITLRDPNTSKQFTLLTHSWSEGCPCCHKNKQCNSHQLVVEMDF